MSSIGSYLELILVARHKPSMSPGRNGTTEAGVAKRQAKHIGRKSITPGESRQDKIACNLDIFSIIFTGKISYLSSRK